MAQEVCSRQPVALLPSTGMSEHVRLIPITASPEEREAALNDLAAIYFELQDQGVDPAARIECEPAGDRWVIEWVEPGEALAA
jgi:hypothetical protein